MVTPELVYFIREQKAKGLVKTDISLLLSQAGWSYDDIKYGLELAESGKESEQPPKPSSTQKSHFLRSKKKIAVATVALILVAAIFFIAGVIAVYIALNA